MIPDNPKAGSAIRNLIKKKQGNELDHHRAKLLVENDKRLPVQTSGRQQGGSDETTDEDDHQDEVDDGVYDGYYSLTFDALSISLMRWAMGRGSKKFGPHRNVDILLAAPNSQQTGGLGSTHVILELNLVSGVWILRASQSFKFGNDLDLVSVGSPRCLDTPTKSLSIVNMRYLVRFSINTQQLERLYLAN